MEEEITFNEKIFLPRKILQVYHQFSTLSEDVYLVGETLLKLLSNQPIDNNEGLIKLDFVFANNLLLPQFFELGFAKIPFTHDELYIKETEEYDLKLSLISQDTTYLNNFTIDSIFCGKNGVVYDPTKMGIHDAESKILRATGCAATQFAQNTLLVLQAIKYIANGYTPTPEVEKALKEWIEPSSEQLLHFKVALSEMRQDSDRKDKYEALFSEYKMNVKLGQIGLEQNLVNLVFALEYNAPVIFSDQTVQSYASRLAYQTNHLKTVPELQKKLSCLKI